MVSNFREDGIATTKKQAKHDAAKKMVERIKGLVDGLSEIVEDDDSSESLKIKNKNAEECYLALVNSKMVNLGIKLDEYHIKLKNSLETEKRNEILQELACIFPEKLFSNSYEDVTDELLNEKLSRVETLLLDINIKLHRKDITNGNYFIIAIVLNTCPSITQMGMGSNKTIASWKALLETITSLRMLLSE